MIMSGAITMLIGTVRPQARQDVFLTGITGSTTQAQLATASTPPPSPYTNPRPAGAHPGHARLPEQHRDHRRPGHRVLARLCDVLCRRPSAVAPAIGFQAVFAACLLLQGMVLPDSPRWLIAHGRGDEGARVIAMLEGKESVEDEGLYRELLEGGPIGNFRRICLCIGINVMQQFTGSNMINYLAPVVYQNTMGLSRNLSLILGGCTSITYMFASFIPLWTVDRFGRRPLLMISATGLSICFIIASILLSTGSKPAAYSATAMVFIFQIFLGIGYLPIPWLYPAEISTTRIRARGSAISSFFNWMCVFAVVEMTPPAIWQNINWRVFIIFAVFNACWVPLVYFFFPETRGLELEAIDHIFEKGGITGGVWESRGQTVVGNPVAEAVEAEMRDFKEDKGKEDV
ncbi:MFS general substrate transporter [Hymenopellis radicata]|nr:MFS general substrate transporter [Hymenopellis radicata]